MEDKAWEHLQDAKQPGGVISNCCGAPVYTPDICSDCKEHCGLMKPCPKCEGEGVLYVQDGPDDFEKEVCPKCDGEGVVELET